MGCLKEGPGLERRVLWSPEQGGAWPGLLTQGGQNQDWSLGVGPLVQGCFAQPRLALGWAFPVACGTRQPCLPRMATSGCSVAVALVGGTVPWVVGDGWAVTSPVGSHLSSVSPGPDVNTSITNYRLGPTFSSWGREGWEEGEVTPKCFTVPWWQEGQALLTAVCQSVDPQRKILHTSDHSALREEPMWRSPHEALRVAS